MEREANRALGEVIQAVQRNGDPFTYDRDTVAVVEATKEQPSLNAFKGFSSTVQERLAEGRQTITFNVNGTVSPARTDGGH